MNQRASDTGRVASTREVDCWENEGGAEKNPAINSEVAEAMAKYGIARVPVDYFHYKEFRYTNLDDAIAQATRQNAPKICLRDYP